VTNNYHTDIVPGAAANANTFNPPLGQLDAAIGNILAGNPLYPFSRNLITTSTARTLASDALDVSSASFITVTSETGTTDNLKTLTNPTAGVTYILQAAAGHTITIKHGTGNIFLNGATDVVLSGNIQLALFYSPLGVATDLYIPTPYVLPTQAMVVNTARTVLGAGAASVTISSIPATYQHLLLILEMRTNVAATGDGIWIRFNADAVAADYYSQNLVISAATSTASESLGATNTGLFIPQSAVGSTGSAGNGRAMIWIENYASTTLRRAAHWQAYSHKGNTTGLLKATVGGGDWTDATNPITSITFLPQTGTQVSAASAYELYGLN
jgi:hypothetical protein